jgi:MFS family permease
MHTGFLIVISQLANIIGRKPVLIASLSWFTIWAAVCGASQTITQLYVQKRLPITPKSNLVLLHIPDK